MTPFFRSISNITTIFYLLLCQISLALALPTNNDLRSRAASAPNLAGAAGKIGAGAFALVMVSLGFGLGAAFYAVKGSLEWSEFRDRNKPAVEQNPVAEEGRSAMEDNSTTRTRADTAATVDTIAEEKMRLDIERDARTRRGPSRLTLKNLVPVDFKDLNLGRLSALRGTNKY